MFKIKFMKIYKMMFDIFKGEIMIMFEKVWFELCEKWLKRRKIFKNIKNIMVLNFFKKDIGV